MASIFDSLPSEGSESFNPSWRDLEPLDDTNSTSREYFQPPQINHFDTSDIRLERDVLIRRINRAVNRITFAILKNQKNFRRLEKELILIRKDVELARSINYKLYKMVLEQEMTQLDQIDDDLLSTVLDVEDAVEDYLVKLKLDLEVVKLVPCCDIALNLDKHKFNGNSRSATMCCLETPFKNVEQSKASPLDSGTFLDTNSIGMVDSELDKAESTLDSDNIHRINCLHRNNTHIKISSFDKSNYTGFNSPQKELLPKYRTTTSHPFHKADMCQHHFLVHGHKCHAQNKDPNGSQFCSCPSMFRQTPMSSQSNAEHYRMSFDSEFSDRVCTL
ncbi:hypothetical protein LOTGIDRAFT_159333 [Lottia gigantea]|uniref:Uncharacterized protein n=1 Tax=Lottia gigantea TaxID=225164 RepID=V4AR56_LOTGI|nr:hypothetical protein LOTGIDRAFT_159333 [Lottia gigantea]ESO97310.1 hypothetical protein LOTGIDRAFT_159333 [Lottia gigantea]